MVEMTSGQWCLVSLHYEIYIKIQKNVSSVESCLCLEPMPVNTDHEVVHDLHSEKNIIIIVINLVKY